MFDESSANDNSQLSSRSDYIFFLPSSVKEDSAQWRTLRTKLSVLINVLAQEKSVEEDVTLEAGLWSHFLSLTCP